MTILAGFSSSRQGSAPLNLAAQIARCTGDKIVATAIVERHWRPEGDPVEDEYVRYVVGRLHSHWSKRSRSYPEISTYRLPSVNQPLSQRD